MFLCVMFMAVCAWEAAHARSLLGNAPGKENPEKKGRMWLLSLLLQHVGRAGSGSQTHLSLGSQPQGRGFRHM